MRQLGGNTVDQGAGHHAREDRCPPECRRPSCQGSRCAGETPLESHAGWVPAADRFDPVALLEAQNKTREQDLVPVRHGRMMVSPFTFYRGAAKIMAGDLANSPTAGLDAQLCGDAHLSNFGGFASPERRLLFDLNDFDETLPGPFEYDVKRMAASFTIAGRNNGFTPAQGRDATLASVRAYREAMLQFAADGHHGTLVRPPFRGRPEGVVEQCHRRPQGRRWQGGQRQGARARANTARTRVTGTMAPRSLPRPRPPGSPRRHSARRIPETACRHCPSSASTWTGGTGSSASHRLSSRSGKCRPACTEMSRAASMTFCANQFREYREYAGGRPASSAGEVRVRRCGAQGGRRRQRRDQVVHRAAGGPRRAGSVVPAGQGGNPVGARGPPAEEPLSQSRRAGGPRPADDAGGQRHLPRLDQGCAGRSLVLLAAAAGHEDVRHHRDHGPVRAQFLRRPVRLDAGQGARPLRRRARNGRIPGRR